MISLIFLVSLLLSWIDRASQTTDGSRVSYSDLHLDKIFRILYVLYMSAIRLSVNSSVLEPTALETWTLPDFRTLFEVIEAASSPGNKIDSDLLVPVADWSRLYRIDQSVELMSSVFFGDLDGLTDDQTVEALTPLQGLSHIVYTTHSHKQGRKQGLNCYRIIIELDREYAPALHKTLWDEINELVKGHLDPGTRKISLGYYLPSHPPEAQDLVEIWSGEGAPYRVPVSVISTEPEESKVHTSEDTPSPFAVESVLTAWSRQGRDVERRAAAKTARELFRGRCTIELHKGQRNGFLTSLAGYIAAVYPDSPGIAALFEGLGWDQFNLDGKYPISAFESMIQRFQAQEHASIAAAAETRRERQSEAVSRLTCGERDYTITPEEVAHLEATFGDAWRQHILAVRKRDTFFLRVDGTYDPDPILRDSIFVGVRDRLAVFGDYVETTYEDEKGVHRKQLPAFLEEYATLVRHVRYDMTRPRGGYDAKEEAIYLSAAVPLVEPVYHQDVEAWLRLLDPHLTDMLAALPRLGDMCPSLILTGGAGAGKTLLAVAIGRIYGNSPADGEEALSGFNAGSLTQQPIIFMDEKVSSGYDKEGTTLIRKLVTQGVRRVEEKYQCSIELLGYPRLIIAANNADILATKQDMSTDDRLAFEERLVHINMDPGVAHLTAKGKPSIQMDWLDARQLSEHIVWLAANHTIQHPGRRFLVANNRTALHDGLASKAGASSNVACWLLNFIASPNKAQYLPIQFEDGKLRVNGGALVQGWKVYLDGHHPPTPHQISRAIKSLSSSLQKIRYEEGGRTKRMDAYEINPLLLRSANDTHQVLENFDELFKLGGTP